MKPITADNLSDATTLVAAKHLGQMDGPEAILVIVMGIVIIGLAFVGYWAAKYIARQHELSRKDALASVEVIQNSTVLGQQIIENQQGNQRRQDELSTRITAMEASMTATKDNVAELTRDIQVFLAVHERVGRGGD